MKKLVSFVVVVFIIACEESYKPEESSVPLRASTSSTAYTVNDPIVVYVTNHTDDPISFERWDGTIFYYRDKLTDSGWVEWTQTGIYPSSEMQRYVLDADEVYVDTIIVRKPGIYRFRFPIRHNDDPSRGDVLTTNSFSIE
jgi:hypothetical protein